MARPIRESPILMGKDAERFVKEMKRVESLTSEQRRANREKLHARKGGLFRKSCRLDDTPVARTFYRFIERAVTTALPCTHREKFSPADRGAIHRIHHRLHEPHTANLPAAGHAEGQDIAPARREGIVQASFRRMPFPVGAGNIGSTAPSEFVLSGAE